MNTLQRPFGLTSEPFGEMAPLGFEAGDANLYRYVGNNATNLTDPSGLQPAPIPPPTEAIPIRFPTKVLNRDATLPITAEYLGLHIEIAPISGVQTVEKGQQLVSAPFETLDGPGAVFPSKSTYTFNGNVKLQVPRGNKFGWQVSVIVEVVDGNTGRRLPANGNDKSISIRPMVGGGEPVGVGCVLGSLTGQKIVPIIPDVYVVGVYVIAAPRGQKLPVVGLVGTQHFDPSNLKQVQDRLDDFRSRARTGSEIYPDGVLIFAREVAISIR